MFLRYFFPMSDSDLALMFQVRQSTPVSQRQTELEAILPELCKQFKRKGVTREQLHKQYLENYFDGYGRSCFNIFIHLYLDQCHPVMHI